MNDSKFGNYLRQYPNRVKILFTTKNRFFLFKIRSRLDDRGECFTSIREIYPNREKITVFWFRRHKSGFSVNFHFSFLTISSDVFHMTQLVSRSHQNCHIFPNNFIWTESKHFLGRSFKELDNSLAICDGIIFREDFFPLSIVFFRTLLHEETHNFTFRNFKMDKKSWRSPAFRIVTRSPSLSKYLAEWFSPNSSWEMSQ